MTILARQKDGRQETVAPTQRAGSRSRDADAKHRAKAAPSLSRAVCHFDAMQRAKGIRRMGSSVSGYHEGVECPAKPRRRRSLSRLAGRQGIAFV